LGGGGSSKATKPEKRDYEKTGGRKKKSGTGWGGGGKGETGNSLLPPRKGGFEEKRIHGRVVAESKKEEKEGRAGEGDWAQATGYAILKKTGLSAKKKRRDTAGE